MINTIHPGEFLNEILEDAGITPYRIAKDIHVPPTRIGDIIKGKRAITVDTAMRLSAYLGTTAQYWLNLQNSYDLSQHEIDDITPLQAAM